MIDLEVKNMSARSSREAEDDPVFKEPRTKRYNLVVGDDLYRAVKEVADAEGVQVVDILRRFIKIGLLVSESQKEPGTSLVIRQGSKEREIVLV